VPRNDNMESVQAIKQRFEIIGNDPKLNRAIEKAIQVAPTDISVLVAGESGVGKENIPRIIHSLSHRKHGKYIAVNCGAIPEGTIDSELFGHEKGSFTGPGWINAGIYLMEREIISEIQDKRFVSLEKEIFPSMIGKDFYGFMNDGHFLDIGTPYDFAKAGGFFKQI